MEMHHNSELAALFRRIAAYGECHAAEVVERAKGIDLPRIAPWDFRWIGAEGPETAGYGNAHYLMTPWHALRFALKNETRGRDYYARVAVESSNPDVAAIAREFADEESEHVRLVREWLVVVAPPEHDWDLELDPPNQPE
ncbi:MAG: rubrerythrin [Proteobacteria bacterium]|nr:MAG: rubrerythrin [Pseudomonadota bacterium]